MTWLVLAAAAALALAVTWTPVVVPAWVPTAAAVAVTTLFTYALAYRTGGRPWLSGGLALVLCLVAILSGLPVLLAGASVGTAALGAVLAVMATVPAAGYPRVVVECLVATAVAAVTALAVHAYGAQVSAERAGYLVLGLSLAGVLGLVYRLGAGWHGLGRRGALMLLSGVVLLSVSLAYSEALARWGAPDVIARIDQLARDVRAVAIAVPRPVAVLVGFPALAWGVSTRARRRQGWWVCAFGAAAMAVVTSSLVPGRRSLEEAGLAVAYSGLLGLLLGYLLVRADQFLTGTRGRRARRAEEAAAHRPEPGRMRPLL
ncbi:MAG TPA: hypothetical protein VFG88_12520 [Nocardioidaceae bacterium]|nr:hypothetical protein [Nocardioidaceae bacterium]